MKNPGSHIDSRQSHSTECGHACHQPPQYKFGKWAFLIAGLMSFIWFLIRVVPKPSRAAYPCQRAAAPLAASFVVWVSGLVGTALAYHKWRVAIVQQRRIIAVVCGAAALTAGIVTAVNLPDRVGAEASVPNAPFGNAKGIHPGRVVWVHNPGATDWAGYSSADRWYDDSHTDPKIVERMMSQAIRGVAGKDTDEEAWNAIFRYFNQTHGRGDRGYYSGEKIMIKLNLATCNVKTNWVSTSTWDKVSTARNLVDNSPQMVKALLKQLVYTVGVNQSDITIGDPTAYWPNCYLNQIRAEYPNVKYLQYGSGPNRTAAKFSAVPFYWSTPDANGKLQDYLPTSYIEASYYINFAVLKGHSSGVTLCGKNDYGSLIRLPNGWMPVYEYQDYYNMHLSLPNAAWSPGMGRYRAIVDLMGHPELGGKALLYLVDGLYGGYYSDGHPYKWKSAPFNEDWPSSVFASQDAVAIDSVGYDFLNAEWPNIVSGGVGLPGSLQGGAEDYIHEAAMANNPASGIFYDPDRDGIRMESLGVHEHWNDAALKQYSRNLGNVNGIELVPLTYDWGSIQRAKIKGNNTAVFVAGAAIASAFKDCFYIESDGRESGIRVNCAGHGFAVGTRVNVSGTITTVGGERCIEAASIKTAGTGKIKPVFICAGALGGGDWNYDSYNDAGQKGISGAHGINNIGILVRMHGRVVSADASAAPPYYSLLDGSGIAVKVVLPAGASVPQAGTNVTVTGISSCEIIGGKTVRLLRASVTQ